MAGESYLPQHDHLPALGEVMAQYKLSSDNVARAQRVAEFSGVDLAGFTTLVHSIVAPGVDANPHPETRHARSPDGSEGKPFAIPAARFPLFQFASELIQKLAALREVGDDQAFLNRAGNIVAMAVVEAHSFEDGNGRTSRTSAALIRDGYQPDNNMLTDKLALMGEERETSPLGFNFKPFKTYAEVQMSPEAVLEAVAALEIPLAKTEQYRQECRMVFMSPFDA